jgi:hypothetical protein
VSLSDTFLPPRPMSPIVKDKSRHSSLWCRRSSSSSFPYTMLILYHAMTEVADWLPVLVVFHRADLLLYDLFTMCMSACLCVCL